MHCPLSNRSRGGATIFWNSKLSTIASHVVGEFAITAKATLLQQSSSFWLTTVYGPTEDSRKPDFPNELARTAPPPSDPWLINGDFNLIYEARDKNNHHLNRRLMGIFRRAIDNAGLKEIKCKNRRYTWSNERENPTLVSIDKFFCTSSWDDLFPSSVLMAASTALSDHCPLLLADAAAPRRRAKFKFESFRSLFPRF